MKTALGLPPDQTNTAAALYWQAFGDKLGRVLGPDPRALRFIASVIDPSHAICALDDCGTVIGIAGFKTHAGAFVAVGYAGLRPHYGRWGSLWRVTALALLSRDTENRRFLIDGIVVAAQARGQGVGTALIAALADEARARHYPALRLDVADTNPHAQRLYTRLGFSTEKTTRVGLLQYVFKFRRSITMTRPVPASFG